MGVEEAEEVGAGEEEEAAAAAVVEVEAEEEAAAAAAVEAEEAEEGRVAVAVSRRRRRRARNTVTTTTPRVGERSAPDRDELPVVASRPQNQLDHPVRAGVPNLAVRRISRSHRNPRRRFRPRTRGYRRIG